MNIKQKLLITILVSSFAFTALPCEAKMSPNASRLYQEACTAEHQQDLKEAISLNIS